jgi:hypothetical protein
MPKSSKIELFKKLGNYDNETRFVNVNEFVGEYGSLRLGNGGSWCRESQLGKKYKFVTVKKKGEMIPSRNCSEEDKTSVVLPADFVKQPGINLVLIKIIGPYNASSSTRAIRTDIKAAFKDSVCVVCGTGKPEIDHKNGLYNDPRVLSTKTQRVEDFQPLCKHCNDQKRQIHKWQTKNGRRYPATKIPMFRNHSIDFVEGDEKYDPNDPNAMVGTYWYDPVEFIKKRDAIIAASIPHIPQ